MIERVYSIDRMSLIEGNGITRRKPRPNATLSTINPTLA